MRASCNSGKFQLVVLALVAPRNTLQFWLTMPIRPFSEALQRVRRVVAGLQTTSKLLRERRRRQNTARQDSNRASSEIALPPEQGIAPRPDFPTCSSIPRLALLGDLRYRLSLQTRMHQQMQRKKRQATAKIPRLLYSQQTMRSELRSRKLQARRSQLHFDSPTNFQSGAKPSRYRGRRERNLSVLRRAPYLANTP